MVSAGTLLRTGRPGSKKEGGGRGAPQPSLNHLKRHLPGWLRSHCSCSWAQWALKLELRNSRMSPRLSLGAGVSCRLFLSSLSLKARVSSVAKSSASRFHSSPHSPHDIHKHRTELTHISSLLESLPGDTCWQGGLFFSP